MVWRVRLKYLFSTRSFSKLYFFGHFSISSNFIFGKIFRCWPSVDQNITDRSETYFNVFHILNQGRIFKIEKNIWWHRPAPQNCHFLGGSRVSDEKVLSIVNLHVMYSRNFLTLYIGALICKLFSLWKTKIMGGWIWYKQDKWLN